MTLSPVEVSVVVPVKNEAENIRPLIAEISAALDSVAAHEIVYVDDGSDDETPAQLVGASQRHPQLRILRHRHRLLVREQQRAGGTCGQPGKRSVGASTDRRFFA